MVARRCYVASLLVGLEFFSKAIGAEFAQALWLLFLCCLPKGEGVPPRKLENKLRCMC